MKKEIKSFIKRCQTELKEYIDEKFDYYRRRRIFFNNSWIRKNPEKIKERLNEYYEKNKDEINRKKRENYKNKRFNKLSNENIE